MFVATKQRLIKCSFPNPIPAKPAAHRIARRAARSVFAPVPCRNLGGCIQLMVGPRELVCSLFSLKIGRLWIFMDFCGLAILKGNLVGQSDTSFHQTKYDEKPRPHCFYYIDAKNMSRCY